MATSGTALPPPENFAPGMIASYWSLVAMTILLYIARTYYALRVTNKYDAAEVTILIAICLNIIMASFYTLAAHYGFGQHFEYVPDQEYANSQIQKTGALVDTFNVLTTLLVRYSISFYILRIKKTKTLQVVLAAAMLVMTMTTIAVVVVANVVPSKAGLVSYIQSGFTIIVDLGLTASPIIILWKVQMRASRKILICVLMSLGLVATISNAARNVYVPSLNGSDVTCQSDECPPEPDGG